MQSNKPISFILIAVLLASTSLLWAKKKKEEQVARMEESKRALHAMERLTFGPRPGDLERVEKMGVDKWVELQLHPEKIDDSGLEARLSSFRTLQMDTETMVRAFPPPQLIKAVEAGRAPMPTDPYERAIYQAQMQRLEERQERKQEKAADSNNVEDGAGKMAGDHKAAEREARMYAELEAEQLIEMPPDTRMQAVLKMTPDEQRDLAKLKPEQKDLLLDGLSPQQRETLLALANPQQVVATELMQGKLIRAAYSERQLEEVMTDFWFNHFNVFLGKGADHYLVTSYERDVIRPRALGKFKDLLVATAESPAMLFYLDNWESVGPNSQAARGGGLGGQNRPRAQRRGAMRCGPFGCVPRGPAGSPPPRPPQRNPQQQGKKQQRGLNENYGRELMELHTLGVDGGYTQKDVTELARVLTGWTIDKPQQGGAFKFDERMHEPGTKVVLGEQITDNGMDEGLKVLDLLAHHPATARFISRKLAMRFVSDDPPQALVDRMARTFLDKDGDIREILRTMFRSPEFWAPEAYRAKVKTPLEFVVSAVRATGADVSDALPLVQTLNKMGMPLYGMQPPTGYKTTADAWVNSAALLDRMNFSLFFASGKMRGITLNAQSLLGPNTDASNPDQALAAMEGALLAGDVSKQTHDTILQQLDNPEVTGRKLDDPPRPPNLGAIAGLILGSPEFQRR